MSRRTVVAVVLSFPLFTACGADGTLSPGAVPAPTFAVDPAARAEVVSMTLLPQPASTVDGSSANDVNDAGTIVGWAFGPAIQDSRAVLWRDGALTVLPSPPPYFFTQAIAISPNGSTIVGRVGGESTGSRPARWTSLAQGPEIYPAGSIFLGSESGAANGVNDAGQIAVAFNQGGLPTFRRYPALWSGTAFTDLAPGESSGSAFDINNAGQVVGTLPAGPFLWQRGTTVILPALGGESLAASINAGGTVAGRTGSRAVLWRSGALQLLSDIPTGGEAADINDHDQVVGSQNGRAFFWQAGGAMIDLGPGAARAINNDGLVVGFAVAGGASRAAAWKLNFAPVARVSGPEEARKRIPLTFSAAGTTDQNGDVITYTWDFGDGSTGTGATVTHSYEKQGTYTVTVTVRDPRGLTSSASIDVSVENAKKPKKDNGNTGNNGNNGNGPK